MSNKLYMVAFVVLILASGGIAFFVKKQLDKKKKQAKLQAPQPTETTTEEPPTGAKPRELEKVTPKLELEASIDVEGVDTVNRKFGYSLQYNGIGTSGTFKDGDPDKLIRKSFGSFSIKQRAPLAILPEAGINPKAQKMEGGSSKKQKMSGMASTDLEKRDNTIIDLKTNTPVAVMVPSDFVDLTITSEDEIHTLTVNLATGERVGGKSPRNRDGD